MSLCAYTACLLPRKASHKRHSSLWRPMRRFHGCTNRSLLSFFLSFFYDIVLDGMRSFDSQVNQRNDEALSMLLHRIVSFQEKLHTKNITHLATYGEEVPWMHKSISSFLLSFFLSFCYDIASDGIRSFNSQVDQRIEEAFCLSLCSYTGCLFFQEKLHIRRRSSRLSCKFPRSVQTPKSITAKM